MRKGIQAFLILAVCAASAPVRCEEAATELAKPINLEQALEIAFENSPEIKAAAAQVQKSRFGVDEAQANFMPRFNAGVTHIRQGPEISFDDPISGQSISIIRAQNTVANAGVQVPVDISKRIGFASDIAKLQYEIDYLSLVSESERLIFRVKGGYVEVLRARAVEEVAQSAVDLANLRLKDAEARFKAGSAPKFDVTRAQVDVDNFNQQLLQARNRVAVARTLFNRILGIDVNTPIELAAAEIEVEKIEVDIPQRLEEAYGKRPEVRQSETLVELNRKNVRLQRTGILPSMDASAVYNYDAQPTAFSTTNTSWVATLNLNIPIWDGGVTRARVDQANADVTKAGDLLEQTRLKVGSEVRIAALNLDDAMKRVPPTQESVDLAQESVRLARVRYEAGIGILVEVTDAESALTRAQFNLVTAKYDYLLALAELERATGSQPELAKLEFLCYPAGS